MNETVDLNSRKKQLVLSDDAQSVLIAGGDGKTHFVWIDLKKKSQHKLNSYKLSNTYGPCFINGNDERVAIGDSSGKIEIWSLNNSHDEPIPYAMKLIDAFPNTIEDYKKVEENVVHQSAVVGMVSSQNILCVLIRRASNCMILNTLRSCLRRSMRWSRFPCT